ncbi:MAG: carbonic anhydrase family protein [Betaproteobacteria bacterium]|nr:carbonic anhydrase family protein [Betaproteobacteria bacterium]
MKKTLYFALPLVAVMSVQATQAAEWGYEVPEDWGGKSSDFVMCDRGFNQTPINIEGALKADLKPLQLQYKNSSQTVVNNGHTVQVDVSSGGGSMVLDDKAFELLQFHFHSPSENHINGKSFPMEVHFVHRSPQGELAVLGLMFSEGKANQQLEEAWKAMPKEKNKPKALAKGVDIHALLPKQLDYYRFSGSLTTPPCTEGVRWLVLKEPVSISKEQIGQFVAVMKQMGHTHTNREVKSLNGRVVLSCCGD